ncbi:hypothetical protein SAMN05216302_102160 [Nitrosomonas aestuarii]|uniref:Uncharacterized protein n=1 Tax=Nitrosomonas aestuarii TaxID=52441 RepID=A0A1I4DHM4_9PROT|nr:hypothetical protein [Nitrosomonas aestuarii]SFK93098.1 hypothetical protein SAMN05216302_102160 [Nitrosomonas aestuarii]
MEKSTLMDIVSNWVAAQTKPFTSRDVLESNDEIDDVTQVANIMNTLFNRGVIARRKIDGVRFSYIATSLATLDFEKTAIKTEKRVHADIAADSSSGIEDLWPAASKKQINTNPIAQAKNSETKPVKNEIKPVIQEAVQPDNKTSSGAVTLPAAFILKLEAPGGIVITITSERAGA